MGLHFHTLVGLPEFLVIRSDFCSGVSSISRHHKDTLLGATCSIFAIIPLLYPSRLRTRACSRSKIFVAFPIHHIYQQVNKKAKENGNPPLPFSCDFCLLALSTSFSDARIREGAQRSERVSGTSVPAKPIVSNHEPNKQRIS